MAQINPVFRSRPYDSNQAIPTLLATRYKAKFGTDFPDLRIASVDWLSFLAYPLSGGLRPWSLLTSGMAHTVLSLEDRVPQAVARHLAFRTLLVVERCS